MKKLLLIFVIFGVALNLQAQKNQSKNAYRNISLDYNQTRGELNTMFKECIGAGRANEGLRADWQQQLAMVKEDCDFKYIRMHGVLSDDMGVFKYDEEGNPQYNFQYVDALYDYLLSIDMKPFVELSFMPAGLASGDKTVFWWEGNITPPANYDNWGALIKKFIQHLTNRYGKEEVASWYFEVWNEPNLTGGFWDGTQEEYFKLYEYAARAVKAVDEDYRIGGPATAGAAWVPEMIQYCEENNVPLDYISTHAYGVKQGYLDEYGTSGTILDKDEWSVSGEVLENREEIEASARPGLELHYTEWNSSYTPADPIHDSYHQPAYILQKLKQVGDALQSMSYWTFTDIFEEAGPRFTPFHGGFGLLNTQGIKKPAYFAYQFLNQLGPTELENEDKKSWACKNENGDVQVLLWDFTNTHPGESELNQTYYLKDLPAKPLGDIKIEINNMPKGKYALKIYQTGYKVNDAYATYLFLERPDQLTKEQVQFMKIQNDKFPYITSLTTVGQDGKLSKNLSMRENDVFLVEVVKL